MKLLFDMKVQRLPMRISVFDALHFHYSEQSKHDILCVMAAYWRIDVMEGEEDWYEELTADEFEDEDFLEDFAKAEFLLCMR